MAQRIGATPNVRRLASGEAGDGMAVFMRNIGASELLDGERERELAVVVQDFLALEAAAGALRASLGREPAEAELAAAAGMGVLDYGVRWRSGLAAKQAMVAANLRLVVSICKKYRVSGTAMGLQDLIIEGVHGLIKGVAKFDPSRGFKFSTYAHWWIRQGVSRALSDQGRMVRLPVHMYEALARVKKAERELAAELGRDARPAEVAARAGLTERKLAALYRSYADPESLEAPVADSAGASTVGDLLEDEAALSPDEAAAADFLRDDLNAVLGGLGDRDAGILRMRYGLGGSGREHTLEEIGAAFAVTRERIRQIEAKAIRKLRARFEARRSLLKDYAEGPLEARTLAAKAAGGMRKSS